MKEKRPREEVIIAGFGGQGILLLGKALAYMGMREGKCVSLIPSYGAEMRGGTAHCQIILSTLPIPYPFVEKPSTLLIMNRPSLDKFEGKVKEKGLILLNTSLVDREVERKDVNVVKVPANIIAEKVGNLRVANMVMLGAYLERKRIIPLEKAMRIIEEVIPPHWHSLVEVNREALKKGIDWVRNGKGTV